MSKDNILYNKFQACNNLDSFTWVPIVVTPLMASMLNGTVFMWMLEFVRSAQDNKTTIGEIINGSMHLLYISPESILTNKLQVQMFLLYTTFQLNYVCTYQASSHSATTISLIW